jgi:hypothetical protein
MSNHREFRFDPRLVVMARVMTLILLAPPLLVFFHAMDTPDSGWLLAGAALVSILGIGCTFNPAFRPHVYAVELSTAGVRSVHRGTFVTWTQIADIKARPVAQRVQLLDHFGSAIASLEYELKDFEEALEIVLEHVGPFIPIRDEFRRSDSWSIRCELPALWLIMLGFSLSAAANHEWAAVVGFLLAAAFATLLRTLFESWGLQRILLGAEGITTFLGSRPTTTPWNDIDAVKVWYRKDLQIVLVLRGGRRAFLHPDGMDVVQLYRAASTWHRRMRPSSE